MTPVSLAPAAVAAAGAVHDAPADGVVRVLAWDDLVLEQHGHDPRSGYAETFWLPLLGPSALLLARRFATELDRAPDGVELSADDCSRSLGLGTGGGRHHVLVRSIGRLAQFRLAHVDVVRAGLTEPVLVRRRFPSLSRTQVTKLPVRLRSAHDAYKEAETAVPAVPVVRERARVMALTLLQLDEEPAEVLDHLRRLRFPPAVSHQAVAWAVEHRPLEHGVTPAA